MLDPYVLMHMRTTVRLDPHLLSEAKKIAAASGTTLTSVIENALRESFSRRGERPARSKLKIPTFGGRSVQAGVDLDNSTALLELMELDRDSLRRQQTRLRSPRRRR